jgi:hypothetical protein
MTSPDATPGDFPERPEGVDFATAATSYRAIPGLGLASILGPLLSWLGGEVSETALMTTAVRAALSSGGDRAAILRAVVANADQIFPDALTRPYIVEALDALAGGVQAKARG